MRFLFYDRVTRIEKGVRIEGVKSFALSEEYLRGHYPRRAVVPAGICIETMAQLLGWGVMHAHDFRLAAIMSLVEGFTLSEPLLRPGMLGAVTGGNPIASRTGKVIRVPDPITALIVPAPNPATRTRMTSNADMSAGW